jgi:hypothetical protein
MGGTLNKVNQDPTYEVTDQGNEMLQSCTDLNIDQEKARKAALGFAEFSDSDDDESEKKN